MENKKETKIFRKLRSGSYMYLSDLGSIIHSSDFNLSIGSLNDEFRFKASNVAIEQGLTPEMLESISSMIKEKAGIGLKKADKIEDEDDKVQD